MDQHQLDLLREQYHDYFAIEQAVLVNIKALSTALPDEERFQVMIPEPFRMASEQATLDRSALKALSQLGDLAEELAIYLRSQAKKLDMLMRYLLIQQDDPTYRRHTHSFGGSALNFLSDQPIASGTSLEVKMFFNGTDGAVYFLTTVIDSVLQETQLPETQVQETQLQESAPVDPGSGEQASQPAAQYLIQSVVSRIRDEDREVLVRASLHEQSRQLKAKARLRQSQGNA
ncbi:PilZ domain-containing protein [Rheinheimera riviphila]|uniref:PilZ domain-containing protein n=1 Tax=Rheinheimera riviphila TaxID=1834037 RepID=A0A437R2U3_9GAMM|nr:PilZ domain-containing protein [Rheinheimera riviphila]RVU41109.1 PilZ domain-containing protein [Rheinheimera riviphila]